MQPLRIDWTFSAPLMFPNDDPVHLDALLAATCFEDARSMGLPDPVATSRDLSHLVEMASNDNGSVWKASKLVFTPSSEIFNTTLVRRTDPQHYQQTEDRGLIHGRARTAINTNSGPERNFFVFTPYQWMSKASAWCIGDEDELREALTKIRYLGKQRRNGFGEIATMTISHDDSALDQWKLRNLPTGMEGAPGVTYIPTQTCLQPPYWDRTQQVQAIEPMSV